MSLLKFFVMANRIFNLLVKQATYLKGSIRAPASKSYTTRAIIIAGLDGKARVANPLICEDTEAALRTIRNLGARIKVGTNKIDIRGLRGKLEFHNRLINVGESGTLLRMVLSMLAIGKGRCVVNGEKTLLKRSNRPIALALRSLGVDIRGRDGEFRLPITVDGKGGIPGGKVIVSGKMSSQTISSLLNIAPFAREDTTIIIKDKVVSEPYIDISIDVLKTAGIKVIKQAKNKFFIKAGQKSKNDVVFKIHGDYSSAAFLIAAACLVESDITITDLVKDRQGDKEIINILNKMGARIIRVDNSVKINGPFHLKGVDINCSNTPDLVPILCAIGCFAKGTTRILDIGHLVHKESNRITAPAAELRKLGADIEAYKDRLLIKESVLRPGCVSSVGDHRIAMSLAIAGLRIGNLTITEAQCISKSYPDFIFALNSLGADLKIIS